MHKIKKTRHKGYFFKKNTVGFTECMSKSPAWHSQIMQIIVSIILCLNTHLTWWKKGHACDGQCRHNNIFIFENLALVSSQRPAKVTRRNLDFNFFNFIVENLTLNRRHQIQQGMWHYVWLKQTKKKKKIKCRPTVTGDFRFPKYTIVHSKPRKKTDKLK